MTGQDIRDLVEQAEDASFDVNRVRVISGVLLEIARDRNLRDPVLTLLGILDDLVGELDNSVNAVLDAATQLGGAKSAAAAPSVQP